MNILFGAFLSGLIVTEFIKASSSALHAEHSISSTLPIVILGAIWVFFVIFDTLVWLVYSEDNPAPLGSVASVTTKMIVLLLRRSLEFGTLIWLYDIVNILNEIKPGIIFDELGLQSRFSLNVAVVCFGWFLWRFIRLFLGAFDSDELRDWRINVSRLIVFAVLFFGFSYLFANKFVISLYAYLIMYASTAIHIFLNYRFNEDYYRRVLPYYEA
jgi:hypothetical protein